MIHVEQAVFGSAQSRSIRGYHIIAQSAGVNDALASKLMPWAPTRKAMTSDRESFDSLSAFVVLEDWLVVARSVYGRPEYSERGELETSTRFLLVPWRALEGYQFNPLWFARTALSLGHLRMYRNDEPQLQPILLPDETLLGVSYDPPLPRRTDYLFRALDQLAKGRQVALIGAEDERADLGFILSHLGEEDRVHLSFTTGLLPSGIRPFDVHFLSPAAYQSNRRQSIRNLDYIDAGLGELVAQ